MKNPTTELLHKRVARCASAVASFKYSLDTATKEYDEAALDLARVEHPCRCVRLNEEIEVFSQVEQERRGRVGVPGAVGFVAKSLSALRSCPLCDGTGKPKPKVETKPKPAPREFPVKVSPRPPHGRHGGETLQIRFPANEGDEIDVILCAHGARALAAELVRVADSLYCDGYRHGDDATMYVGTRLVEP